MTEQLSEVKLTAEQEARAASLWEAMTYKGARDAARLIVHQQDRIAEMERLLREVIEEDDDYFFMGEGWRESADKALAGAPSTTKPDHLPDVDPLIQRLIYCVNGCEFNGMLSTADICREAIAEIQRLRKLFYRQQESQLRTALDELRAENPFDKSKAVFAGKSKDGYLLKCWFDSQEDLDAAFDVVERLPSTTEGDP